MIIFSTHNNSRNGGFINKCYPWVSDGRQEIIPSIFFVMENTITSTSKNVLLICVHQLTSKVSSALLITIVGVARLLLIANVRTHHKTKNIASEKEK